MTVSNGKSVEEVLKPLHLHHCQSRAMVPAGREQLPCDCHVKEALAAIQEIIEKEVLAGDFHDAWCEPSSERGCTCHIAKQRQRLKQALTNSKRGNDE